MNVLITGGAGYLGYHLVKTLENISEISSITIYDNLYRKNFNFFMVGNQLNKVKFIKGDLLNEYALSKACDNQEIVIHLAAFVENPYSYKDNFKYEQINQYGTGILYNVLRNVPTLKKVIFASSTLVYGFQDVLNEETHVQPSNGYGKSKIEGEKYMNLLNCDVYTPRIANVYGYNPMCRFDSVVNSFITNALLYNKIQIMGTGEQYRPFVHIDKVAQYIQQVIQGEQTEPIINLVQESRNLNDLLDLLLELQPDLEYVNVNANQTFSGYKVASEKHVLSKSFYNDFNQTYQEFKKHFRI